MIDLLIYLAVFVIVVMLVWWLLQQLALPEPIGRILTIVLVVVAAIFLIGLLLQLAGTGPSLRLR